jgi:hypothetical protein
MQERIYETRQGTVTAKAINARQAKNLKDGLPLGMVSIKLNDQANEHGVVIRCGEEDAWCLKQQSVEVDPKNEQTVLLANTLILAHSIKGYLDHGFGGCFIPALYRKKKPNGVEIGFAYFGSPCPTGIEASEFPPTPADDQHFGDGFFTMYRHFYEELKKSSQKMNVTLAPVIGLDQRTSTHLEGIVLHCIIHGRTVYLCSPRLDEDDYLLTYLAATGIKEVVHLPCRPVRIEEKYRDLAKADAPPKEEKTYKEELDRLQKKAEQKLKAIRQAKGTNGEKEGGQ